MGDKVYETVIPRNVQRLGGALARQARAALRPEMRRQSGLSPPRLRSDPTRAEDRGVKGTGNDPGGGGRPVTARPRPRGPHRRLVGPDAARRPRRATAAASPTADLSPNPAQPAPPLRRGRPRRAVELDPREGHPAAHPGAAGAWRAGAASRSSRANAAGGPQARRALPTSPSWWSNVNDKEALELAIIENVQRADLNAIEEARGYERLAREFGHSQTDLARIIGKSRSHVANMIRLLKLPGSVEAMVVEGSHHGRPRPRPARLRRSRGRRPQASSSPRPQRARRGEARAGTSTCGRGRSRRHRTRRGTEGDARPGTRGMAASHLDIRAMAQRLAAALGLAVEIEGQRGPGGEIRIRYSARGMNWKACAGNSIR